MLKQLTQITSKYQKVDKERAQKACVCAINDDEETTKTGL
jgi:hypothetical protein